MSDTVEIAKTVYGDVNSEIHQELERILEYAENINRGSLSRESIIVLVECWKMNNKNDRPFDDGYPEED